MKILISWAVMMGVVLAAAAPSIAKKQAERKAAAEIRKVEAGKETSKKMKWWQKGLRKIKKVVKK